KVLGENTMTKLMPRLCQSTARRLAMVAVRLRPRTLTVILSDLETEPVRDAVLERHQWRTSVGWLPPLPFNQTRPGRKRVRIGDAAIAAQGPGGIRRRFEVIGGEAAPPPPRATHPRTRPPPPR